MLTCVFCTVFARIIIETVHSFQTDNDAVSPSLVSGFETIVVERSICTL